MSEKFFAFESGKVSIAFPCPDALGDCLIAKKVFDALVELVPDCRIDIFYNSERGKNFGEAFYGRSKNLNCILSSQNFYQQNVRKYDAALRVWHMVLIDFANVERLQKVSPALLHSLQGIDAYNKRYVFNTDAVGIILRNITRAHILGINRYTCLSCGGALPIHDNKVEIHLSPEGDRQFQKLGLSKNYITVGSNVGKKNNLARHSLKEWPTACVTEYISLLNIYLPQVAVVQVGGGGVEIFPNADFHLLDADMELVKHVLKNSLLHVDCESGLVHLASQLGTKCLVLFGPTDEKYYGFKENLNLVSEVCRPCVWAWDDGSICLRGAKEPPCMLNFTPQTVCEVTCNYINHLELKNNS